MVRANLMTLSLPGFKVQGGIQVVDASAVSVIGKGLLLPFSGDKVMVELDSSSTL